MGIAVIGYFPTTGCSFQQTGLNQERLHDIFKCIQFLSQGDSQVLDTNRPTREMLDNQPQITSIQRLQTQLVDTQSCQSIVGYFTIAPLYRDMNGEDLLTEEALTKQVRFFADLVALLFADEAPPPKSSS